MANRESAHRLIHRLKTNGGSKIPDVIALGRICEAMPDWWAITPAAIDELSYALLGKRGSGRWLRRGPERAIIAKRKFGADAVTLNDELCELSRQAKRILLRLT